METSYEGVINRMKGIAVAKNDTALAKILGITPQAISNYKKKGELPSSLILKFAKKFDCSIDFLVKGDKEEKKGVSIRKDGFYLKNQRLLPGDCTLQQIAMVLNAIELDLEFKIVPMKDEDKIQVGLMAPPPSEPIPKTQTVKVPKKPKKESKKKVLN